MRKWIVIEQHNGWMVSEEYDTEKEAQDKLSMLEEEDRRYNMYEPNHYEVIEVEE